MDGKKTEEKENRLKKMGEKLWFSAVWITKENRKERKVDRKMAWAPLEFFSLRTRREDGGETGNYSFCPHSRCQQCETITKLPLKCAN